jgi:hypothetical protein
MKPDGTDARTGRADHVVLPAVSDHNGPGRTASGLLESEAKYSGIRFQGAGLLRADEVVY